MMSNQRLQALMAQPCTRVCLIGEDGRYAAEAVELPGCYASGDTAAEAMTELEHAMVSWIRGRIRRGARNPPTIHHRLWRPALAPHRLSIA